MKRYKVLEKFFSVCAILCCAALLITATLASAAARFGLGSGALSDGAGHAETDGAWPDAGETRSADPFIELIYDPDGAYALEFYDMEFYSGEAEIPVQGEYTIVSKNLAASSVYDMFNETRYKPDIDALLAKYGKESIPAAVYTSLSITPEPLVLIVHTHGTESFAPPGATSYSLDDLPRSEDTSQNIIAVGKAMRDEFLANGIPALHCEIMHDKDSYKDSYKKSLATVLAYLEKYPSIKYVFDVHRDALIGNGTITKCVYEQNGVPIAQVMFVVGTDEGGAEYPHWQNNLAFALAAQSLAAKRYPGMMRPINLRKASFNAQYSYRNLLIEVGACANTLAEAKTAGTQIASVLSELIALGY